MLPIAALESVEDGRYSDGRMRGHHSLDDDDGDRSLRSRRAVGRVLVVACSGRRRRDMPKMEVSVWPKHGATAAPACTLFVPLWVFWTGRRRLVARTGRGGGSEIG